MKRLILATLALSLAACSDKQESASALHASNDSVAPALTETQSALQKAFESLVDKDENSEATLAFAVLTTKADELDGTLFADAAKEVSSGIQVSSFKFEQLYAEDSDGDARLAEIAVRLQELNGGDSGDWAPFYCSRFNTKPDTGSTCSFEVVNLLSALSHDPDAQVWLSTLEGNDYGTLRSATLYVAPKYDGSTGEQPVIKIHFDVVHEI